MQHPPTSDMTSSVGLTPHRTDSNDQPSNIGNENGNVFTLTNIYTFGVNGNNNVNGSNGKTPIKSFVEGFDPPSSSDQDSAFERYHEEKYSSSSITRKTYTSSIDKYDYQVTNTSRTGSELSTRERKSKMIIFSFVQFLSPCLTCCFVLAFYLFNYRLFL